MRSSRLPDRLGRFEIQAPLGAGAFARVVRAYDPELSSSVAIKILADQWADDTDARERFLAEARHLRRVRNPSVVAVHDIGNLDDGRPYFVMELADRGSLEERLAQRHHATGDSDADGLARLIRGLADGLGAIHAAGLVHRDLNPRNLLLASSHGRGLGPDTSDEADHATAVGLSIVRDDERLVIADLGLAKDLVESRAVSVIGGSAGYQSPEQLDIDAELGPPADVFAATALLWRVLTGATPPSDGEFEARRHEVAPEWRPLLRRGLAHDPGQRHQTIAGWSIEALDVLGFGTDDAGPATRPAVRTEDCPYRGLASYEAEHAVSFFGRETVTSDAIERLRHDRVLAVLGASGSGKSSVVRAGVVPGLQAGELTGSERWPLILMTPGADPLGELRYQLIRTADALGVRAPSPAEWDHDAEYAWRRAADSIVDQTDGLVLCIDQFEEIFTHDLDGDAAPSFVAALAAMVDPGASRVRLVFAMRADFYGDAARHPWLAKRLADNQILVGPMEAAQLRRAITGPAERVGLEIEDGLVDTIVAEVGTDPGALPLLGHALVETWRRRDGRRLTVAGFRGAGGVAGAIAQTADAVYEESLDDAQRQVARDLLLRLVTVRPGLAHTRRTIVLAELDDDPETEAVVDQLVGARLLTVDDTTVQIAHEALISQWPRLRQWIDDDIDDLRMRSHLSRAAGEWDDLDRDPAMLYRGTPLVAAEEWAATSPGQLGPTERAFLAASTEAAAAEDERMARDARRRRVARGLGVGAVVGLLLIAFMAWAGIQRTRAVERSNAAETRVLENLGLVARLTTDTDPLVGLALGVEARSLTEGPNRDAWLAVVEARRALAESGIVEIGAVDTGDALSVALTPDGTFAAVGGRDGGIHLVDIDARRVISTATGHSGGVPALAFHPDGGALASAGFDDTVQIRTFDDGGLAADADLSIDLGSLVWDVAWSPDGHLLATASEDGRVQLWDTASGVAVGGPLVEAIDMLTVAFSPDGRTLIASNGEGLLWGFDVTTGEARFAEVAAHQSDIWELVFSPDGEVFATSSGDGTVSIRRTADGTEAGSPFVDESGRAVASELRGIQFTPDGAGIVAGSGEGELLWWDLAAGTLVARDGPTGGLPVLGSGLAGDRVVTLARDQALRIWRLGSRVPLGVALPTEGGAHAVAIAPDRSLVVTGDGSGAVRFHDPDDGAELWSTSVSDEPVRAVAISPDGRVVLAGTDEGRLVSIDVEARTESTAQAHDSRVRAIAFDPAGERIATGSKDGTVRVWRAADGEQLAEFGAYDFEGVEALAWRGDGERLAAVGFDGRLDVWSPTGERLAGPVVVDGDALQSVAFSAGGDRIAVGGGQETATVWTADLEEQIAGPFATMPDGTRGVAFLDDDSLLLAVSGDGTVRLWDLDSDLPVGAPFTSNWAGIRDVAVVADGPLVAVASVDGDAWLWHVLDRATACSVIDGLVDRAQPEYLGEGGELTACDGES